MVTDALAHVRFLLRWSIVACVYKHSKTKSQQQRHTAESAAAGTRTLVQKREWNKLTQQTDPELPCVRKLKRSSESPVEKEELEFEVGLRTEGIAQDVILEDEERVVRIQTDIGKFTKCLTH